ncbi:Uncharacterized protein cmbei_3001160 [Cryptosporidium meleagridis]
MKRSKFNFAYDILKFFLIFIFFVCLKTRHDLIKYDQILTQNYFKPSNSSKLDQFYQIISVSFINDGLTDTNSGGAKDIKDNESGSSSTPGNSNSNYKKQTKTHFPKTTRSSSCSSSVSVSCSSSNSDSNYGPSFKLKSRSRSESCLNYKARPGSKTRSRSKTRSKSKTRSRSESRSRSRSESRSRSRRLIKKLSKSDSSLKSKPSTSRPAPLDLEDRIGSCGPLSSKEELDLYCVDLSVNDVLAILQSGKTSDLADTSSCSLNIALDHLICLNSSLAKKLIDVEKAMEYEKSKLNPSDKNYERRMNTLRDFVNAESRGILKQAEKLFELIQILFQILYSRRIHAFESTSDAITSQNSDPKVNTSRRIAFSSELTSNLSVLYNMLHCDQSFFSNMLFCRFLQDLIENNERVNKALTQHMVLLEKSDGTAASSSKVNIGGKSKRKTRTRKKKKHSKNRPEDPERENQDKKMRKLNSQFRKLFTNSNIGLESIE